MNQILKTCSKVPRIITVAAILIIIPRNHLGFRIWLYIIHLSLSVAGTMNNCISLISFPRSLINFSTFNLRVNTFICNPLIPTKMMLNESTWYHPIITNIVENGTSAEKVLKHFRKRENKWTWNPEVATVKERLCCPDSKVRGSGLEREVGLKEKE